MLFFLNPLLTFAFLFLPLFYCPAGHPTAPTAVPSTGQTCWKHCGVEGSHEVILRAAALGCPLDKKTPNNVQPWFVADLQHKTAGWKSPPRSRLIHSPRQRWGLFPTASFLCPDLHSQKESCCTFLFCTLRSSRSQIPVLCRAGCVVKQRLSLQENHGDAGAQ